MQVSEFRKELQEAIIALEKIARKIDEQITLDEQAAQDDALRNAALAQARLEVASGVTRGPASGVPHDNPVDFNASVAQHTPTADEKAAIEAKQRQARLDAQAAAKKANEA